MRTNRQAGQTKQSLCAFVLYTLYTEINTKKITFSARLTITPILLNICIFLIAREYPQVLRIKKAFKGIFYKFKSSWACYFQIRDVYGGEYTCYCSIGYSHGVIN
jgi:hypothetical protein